MQNRITDSSQSGSIIRPSYRQQHHAICILFRAELVFLDVFWCFLYLGYRFHAKLLNKKQRFRHKCRILSLSERTKSTSSASVVRGLIIHIPEEPITGQLATLQQPKLLEPASLTRDDKPWGEEWLINTTTGTRLDKTPLLYEWWYETNQKEKDIEIQRETKNDWRIVLLQRFQMCPILKSDEIFWLWSHPVRHYWHRLYSIFRFLGIRAVPGEEATLRGFMGGEGSPGSPEGSCASNWKSP